MKYQISKVSKKELNKLYNELSQLRQLLAYTMPEPYANNLVLRIVELQNIARKIITNLKKVDK